MSLKERERLRVFGLVAEKKATLADAAVMLRLSARQCRRIYLRYQARGDKGLVHRGRGRPSNRATKAEEKAAILARYQERYADFGPTLAAEKLGKEGHIIDHETLRGWLIAVGLWKKKRKRKVHRSWREPRSRFGEMVQMDGSDHNWFELESGKRCCLMNAVDDATSTTMALLAEGETIFAAMRLLWEWIKRYGIPLYLYTDKKNVYLADEKIRERARESGEEALTQFGRACKELGIEIIPANSPQAKGRVERSNGVYQDRFVKELRLEQIKTIEEANNLLFSGFTDDLNEKFARPPADETDYHRSSEGYDLASIFSIKEQREVSADWTVRFENKLYQLEPQSNQPPTTSKVMVQKYINGELHISYRGHDMKYTILTSMPEKRSLKKRTKPRAEPKEKWVPGATHPWRKKFITPTTSGQERKSESSTQHRLIATKR